MSLYLVLFFICLVVGLTGQILLKKGMNKIGEVTLFSKGMLNLVKTIRGMFTNVWIIFGVLLFGGSTLLWLVILSGLDLSYIYPMVSLNYVLAALSSKIFFKERISKMRWLSLGIIILGVILVSLSQA